MLQPIDISSDTAIDGRRYYIREGYSVPSVTTILGATADQTYLNRWRANNPDGQSVAANRGNAVHSAIENFLLHGVEPDRGQAYPFFQHIKPLLQTIKPHFLELPIFSKQHGFAGRVDCGALLTINGEDYNILIDWKTSAKKKYKWYDYPLQLAAYLNGFRETYPECGIPFSHTMIVCVNPEGVQLELFEAEQIDFYWEQFKKRLKQFKDFHVSAVGQ
jgi:hypothetical protein